MARVKVGKFDFNQEIFKQISDDAKDFISSCLVFDEAKRPSAEQILAHKWLKQEGECCKLDEAAGKKYLDNMRKFHADTKFAKATYAFLASQVITTQDKMEADKIFKKLDKNQNGILTKEELIQGYAELYGQDISNEEVGQIFDKMDLNKDGKIEYSEFIVAALDEKNLMSEKRLKAAFDMYDKDKSGSISAEEIKKVLSFGKDIDEQLIVNIIKQVDENNDGELQFNEFFNMMHSHCKDCAFDHK